MLKAKIPMPPPQHAYWNYIVKRGRAVKLISKQGRAYKKTIATHAMAESWERFGGKRVSIFLEMHDDANRKNDLDNYLKSLFDALTHAGIWGDDSQVDEIHFYRGPKVTKGDRHMLLKIFPI